LALRLPATPMCLSMVRLLIDRRDPKDRGAGMLILTRRIGERIFIGDQVFLTVVGIRGDQIRLGIAAPRSVVVHRRRFLPFVLF